MAKRHRVLVSDKISQRALETLKKNNIHLKITEKEINFIEK